ncbi:DNA-binding protein [Burkholderia stagnalis]|nr:DNA-binding protein [Burkholderia stagnalis]
MRPSRRRYNELLRDAIVDAWDGSDEHGRALLVVIQGLKDLQGKADDG